MTQKTTFLLQKVQDYILKNALLEAEEELILGISGGADSVCLFHILKELGYKLTLAHVNFNLRGAESDSDETFVRVLAREYGCAIHVHKAAQPVTSNVQQWARTLRYDFFEHLSQKLGIKAVAVAHHQDDSFETLLLNLVKGGSWRRLSGIRTQNKHVIRPLLALNRTEIENYLILNNLSYRTDSSNAENKYQRNFLRSSVVPLLKELNPSLEQTFASTAQRLWAADRLLTKLIAEKLQRIVQKRNNCEVLKIDALLKEDEPEFLLYEWLSPKGYSYAATCDIFSKRNLKSGKLFLSATHALCTNRHELVLGIRHQEVFKELTIENLEAGFQVLVDQEFVLKLQDKPVSNAVWQTSLDFQKVVFPLTLRPWCSQDVLQPNSRSGRKKINKILTEAHISVLEKPHFLILLNANQEALCLINQATHFPSIGQENSGKRLVYVALCSKSDF